MKSQAQVNGNLATNFKGTRILPTDLMQNPQRLMRVFPLTSVWFEQGWESCSNSLFRPWWKHFSISLSVHFNAFLIWLMFISDRKGNQIFSFKHLYFALWAEYESTFQLHYIFVRLVRKTSGNFHKCFNLVKKKFSQLSYLVPNMIFPEMHHYIC